MEEPIIVEGSVVHHRPDAYRTPPTRGLEPPLGLGPASLSVPPVTPAALPPDPEFDAYLAVVKTLLGGAVEGTAELARRLERLEAALRA
ncbi:MAG: hypothetical protein KA170_19730, partial [Candidatus Promineofilum sp.]|nr:hypothetical protein [Promineifilum sp.]